jgi:hypothetical protein
VVPLQKLNFRIEMFFCRSGALSLFVAIFQQLFCPTQICLARNQKEACAHLIANSMPDCELEAALGMWVLIGWYDLPGVSVGRLLALRVAQGLCKVAPRTDQSLWH